MMIMMKRQHKTKTELYYDLGGVAGEYPTERCGPDTRDGTHVCTISKYLSGWSSRYHGWYLLVDKNEKKMKMCGKLH